MCIAVICFVSSTKDAFIKLAHTIEHAIAQSAHHGAHHHNEHSNLTVNNTQHNHQSIDLLVKLFDTDLDKEVPQKKESYNTDKRLSISKYTTPSNLQAHTKKDNYYYLLKPYTSIRWLPFEPPQA